MFIETKSSLYRRYGFTTDRTLKAKPHPALKTGSMEDVPARSHHVLPTTQNARSPIGHTSARRSERGENRNLDILHADSTVEHNSLSVPIPLFIVILGITDQIPLIAPKRCNG